LEAKLCVSLLSYAKVNQCLFFSLAFSNIRKFLVAKDGLYAGVSSQNGGHVLKFMTNPSNPLDYIIVGNMDTGVAELVEHEHRIFVTTWPNTALGKKRGTPQVAGLYMSPSFSNVGLNENHAEQWVKVWSVTDYEPYDLIAYTYGGGALASYGGYLYWGTMHVPLTGLIAHAAVHGLSIGYCFTIIFRSLTIYLSIIVETLHPC
jgi:hypothetical protein